MRIKHLLLGAASVLMLAACSEDVKGPDSPNNNPVEDALSLTSLSPSSQSGRVILPGQTRGLKSDRLQLVAKIAPVAESFAAEHNWSATGIAISNGSAYVSWHSNRQASVNPGVSLPADAWGGAIDEISISDLVEGKKAGVIKNTLVSQAAKFNNIVADGNTFYLPITSYSNGAVVGRWQPDVDVNVVDTLAVPGSSANSIYVDNDNLYIATGYQGGLYSLKTDFDKKNAKTNKATQVLEYKEDFGGKYVADGYLLRTDDAECQIIDINSKSVRNTGAPLLSAEKDAEYYDGESWIVVEGKEATHYGKHTMAKLGDYIYVGGGKGENAQNGLRVYDESGIVWENGTNTTAVCVAEVNVAPEGQTAEMKNFIFAATGVGLRVYEPYNGRDLPLYAYEVLNYDENGNAADVPGTKRPQAGTDAHSSNFVAVDSQSGLIFVACGQSGVYVFRLRNVAPDCVTVTLAGRDNGNPLWTLDPKEVEPSTADNKVIVDFTIPQYEWKDGGKLVGWVFENSSDDADGYGEGHVYKSGETVHIEAPTIDELMKEVFMKPFVMGEVINKYTYTVTWYEEDGTTELDKQSSTDKQSLDDFKYSKDDPTKAEDEDYTYEFDKWVISEESGGIEEYVYGSETVTGCWRKYKATYTATPKGNS